MVPLQQGVLRLPGFALDLLQPLKNTGWARLEASSAGNPDVILWDWQLRFSLSQRDCVAEG